MASYEAEINLLISGMRELDALERKLDKVGDQILEISKLDISPPQKAGGGFAQDPNRQARELLGSLLKIQAAEEEIKATIEDTNNRRKATINFQSKLNTAVNQYTKALEELDRGGAGQGLSSELQSQAVAIQKAYDVATQGGKENITLIRTLAAELNSIVQIQNQINRLSSFQTKSSFVAQGFESQLSALRSKASGVSAGGGVSLQGVSLQPAAKSVGTESISELEKQISQFRAAVSAGLESEAEKLKVGISGSLNLLKAEINEAAAKSANAQSEISAAISKRQDAVKSWSDFFSDATQEAEKLKTETLQKYARLRGAQASEIPMGPLPAGRAGGPRYLQEELEMINELLVVEVELAQIRDQSLKESVTIEEERLKLVEERRKKEKEIRDTIFDAITFGKGKEVSAGVQGAIENVKSGTTNALVRGGLTAGTFALGKGALAASTTLAGAAAGMTAHEGVLASIQNIAGGVIVNAVESLGDSFNSALGGVPEIFMNILNSIGNVPTEIAAATIALMAFAPAAKTAAEATFNLGKALGQSGLGRGIKEFSNDIKLALDSQTNIFESAVDAMSSMEFTIGDPVSFRETENAFSGIVDLATEMNVTLNVTTDYMQAVADVTGDLGIALKGVDGYMRAIGQQRIEDMLNVDQMAKAVQQLAPDMKELNTRRKAIELRKEEILQIKRAEEFERKLAAIRERDALKKQKTAFNENLALGVGFPLMFGAGPGSVAGSAIGSFFGSGFGGQILGGAIGQMLDQAVASTAKLGNTLITVNGEYSKLREQGVAFSAELEQQARLLARAGEPQRAQQVVEEAIFTQTGDINALGVKAGTSAVNELQKAWDGVLKTVQPLLGILLAPFIFALTAILRVVQGILFVVNMVITNIMMLIALIPGIAELGEFLGQSAAKNTAEYENQINELNKQIEAQHELIGLEASRVAHATEMLGMTSAEAALYEKQIEGAERRRALEKEIKDLMEKTPPATDEGRQKQQEFIHLKREEFLAKEMNIALKNAQSIYTEIVDNNRDIAEKNKQNAQQYYDMVLQNARAQYDFDIAVARKVQDAQMKMIEQRFEFEKRKRQEGIKMEELANKQASMQRSLAAAMSSTPEEGALLNMVQTALDEWRTGRKSVEQEAQDKQRSVQLEAQKAMIAIERYKLDNALRIARANEDSHLKIRRINEQINKQNDEVSRKGYERQTRGATAALRALIEEQVAIQKTAGEKLQGFYTNKVPMTKKEVEALARAHQDAGIFIRNLDNGVQSIQRTFSSLSVSAIAPMGRAPGLTDTSGAATSAEKAAVQAQLNYQQEIAALETLTGITAQNVELAAKFLDPAQTYLQEINKIVKAQQEKVKYEQIYAAYIKDGVTPALAEQLAQTRLIGDEQEKNISILIKALRAAALLKENAINKDRLNELASQLEAARGVIQEKTTAALTQIQGQASFASQIASEAVRAREELNLLLDPIQMVKSAAAGIGDAFSQSFMGVINGTMTAQDALASFFNNVANFFLDMAGKIIAKWIEMTILNSVLQLFPGAPTAPINPLPNAYGNAFGANGIIPFAKGGMFTNSIVSSPTLFKFADGAAMRTGVMGEAGSEAIMPLTRGPGGALGVQAYGGGGGDTNITIHVDATGTKVAGDDTNAKELGRVVTAAVQTEIIKQQRPGGLLNR